MPAMTSSPSVAKKRFCSALIISLVILAAGCGGGSSSDSGDSAYNTITNEGEWGTATFEQGEMSSEGSRDVEPKSHGEPVRATSGTDRTVSGMQHVETAFRLVEKDGSIVITENGNEMHGFMSSDEEFIIAATEGASGSKQEITVFLKQGTEYSPSDLTGNYFFVSYGGTGETSVINQTGIAVFQEDGIVTVLSPDNIAGNLTDDAAESVNAENVRYTAYDSGYITLAKEGSETKGIASSDGGIIVLSGGVNSAGNNGMAVMVKCAANDSLSDISGTYNLFSCDIEEDTAFTAATGCLVFEKNGAVSAGETLSLNNPATAPFADAEYALTPQGIVKITGNSSEYQGLVTAGGNLIVLSGGMKENTGSGLSFLVRQ